MFPFWMTNTCFYKEQRKLNDKDMLLQRTKKTFEELVNRYKYVIQEMTTRPTGVNKNTNVICYLISLNKYLLLSF